MSEHRVFAIRPGVDFGEAFIGGLFDRYGDRPPEEMAKIQIFVNTRRTQRRLRDLLDRGPARLLPRIHLITDLGSLPQFADIPPAISPLRRRLTLAQLIGRLLESEPDLAPMSARFDLADSLSALIDEMQGEGVSPSVLEGMDVSDQSGHWQRALRFVLLVQAFFEESKETIDPEGRQRLVVERLAKDWKAAPPKHPVIVTGSTGSRGTTRALMRTVASLQTGAVVLPGVDPHMPGEVWQGLQEQANAEDHPQYRFALFCKELGIDPSGLPEWSGAEPTCHARGALVSMALRPAPVTDSWVTDGPKLPDLGKATDGLTLIEAPSPRAEAQAIAVRLRQALDADQTAALVTPDRNLSRQVASVLDRWGIVADDSAGIPLHLTPPGRFLRHTADLLTQTMTSESLLVLLKHPLCHSGTDRGIHVLRTTALELQLRRNGPPFPTGQDLLDWADGAAKDSDGLREWATWLADLLVKPADGPASLQDWVERHKAIAEPLAQGSKGTGAGTLWDLAAGTESSRVLADLCAHTDHAGLMSASDYVTLLARQLAAGEVRDRDRGHPQVLFWGTLEARVQGADLVVLGGLNEGSWPESPAPDPWLNRRLRKDAGLLLPERRIGLSAHDFQLATNAPTAVLSRSIRSDEAETVPSRWVNRLTNLLEGLTETGGPDALGRMRARGTALLTIAEQLDQPEALVPAAGRPSPRPPVAHRPKSLSVTQIRTLIRDPYAIYARHILGLNQLDPLVQKPDALLRGNVFHKVLEVFARRRLADEADLSRDTLLAIATEIIEDDCPWPSTQRQWLARFRQIADAFLEEERIRGRAAKIADVELWGEAPLDQHGFTLVAKADRMDRAADGSIHIYDYKTGQAPSSKQQLHFDNQLLLEAAMVELGAFKSIGPAKVQSATFLQLTNPIASVRAPLDKTSPDEIWSRFTALIERWMSVERGYTARLSNVKLGELGPYDHLARYGEWDETHAAEPENLT